MSDKPLEEILSALEDLRKEINEKYGGTLPNPRAAPDFYAKLTALLDIIKEEGIELKLVEIADRLGVSYALLRKRLHEYRKLEAKSIEELESPAQVSTPSKETEPSPKPSVEPVEITSGDKETASHAEDKPSEEPTTPRTAVRIMEAVKRHFGKKAEQLAKEEVDKIIKFGKIIYEDYEKQCYASGFEDPEECIRAAFTALFQVMPEYHVLREKCDHLENTVKALLKLSHPYLGKLLMLNLVSKNLTLEERLNLVTHILEE